MVAISVTCINIKMHAHTLLYRPFENKLYLSTCTHMQLTQANKLTVKFVFYHVFSFVQTHISQGGNGKEKAIL